jgi:Resolvase, N terminal domain
MTIIGYARVSTTDQDLSIQRAALKAAGCDVIRAEKRSGTTTAGREELRTLLDFLRKGDVLMVIRATPPRLRFGAGDDGGPRRVAAGLAAASTAALWMSSTPSSGRLAAGFWLKSTRIDHPAK